MTYDFNDAISFSAFYWAKTDRLMPEVRGLPQPVLHQEAPKLSEKYPLVVIDSPSGYHDSTIPRSAIAAASLVIIPVQPSAVDIWSARDTVKLIDEAKVLNPNLKAMLLVSRAITNTRLGAEAREALEALGLFVFKTAISQRIALAETPLQGKLILDYPNPARDEFRSLAEEVMEVINHGKEVSQKRA